MRVFITGASRGIGKEIALKLAKQGASIVVTGKTKDPHPKLPGTIMETAAEVEKLGGRALPLTLDIREEEQIEKAVATAAAEFGGIDVLINNASAIYLTPTLETTSKQWDLMHQINSRGTFFVTQKVIPRMKDSKIKHIINLSPPLSLDSKWFAPHGAYTLAKFSMSFFVLGMAREFKDFHINALWPKTLIGTAAVMRLGGDKMMAQSRKPEILADCVAHMLEEKGDFTGQFLIDEDYLRTKGVSNFDHYHSSPGNPLLPDFYVD